METNIPRKLTPAEIEGAQTIGVVKDILNGETSSNSKKANQHENWIKHCWNLYTKNEMNGVNEEEYRSICLSSVLDEYRYYYFALVCSMRFQNVLRENERVLCRPLISQNPIHTSMINNINQQMYNGDVVCYIGPYISAEEADHAPLLAKSRKIDGKILIMINIARAENKKITWVMLPPSLFSIPNICTLFLPHTIDDFDYCYGISQNSVLPSE